MLKPLQIKTILYSNYCNKFYLRLRYRGNFVKNRIIWSIITNSLTKALRTVTDSPRVVNQTWTSFPRVKLHDRVFLSTLTVALLFVGLTLQCTYPTLRMDFLSLAWWHWHWSRLGLRPPLLNRDRILTLGWLLSRLRMFSLQPPGNLNTLRSLLSPFCFVHLSSCPNDSGLGPRAFGKL